MSDLGGRLAVLEKHFDGLEKVEKRLGALERGAGRRRSAIAVSVVAVAVLVAIGALGAEQVLLHGWMRDDRPVLTEPQVKDLTSPQAQAAKAEATLREEVTTYRAMASYLKVALPFAALSLLALFWAVVTNHVDARTAGAEVQIREKTSDDMRKLLDDRLLQHEKTEAEMALLVKELQKKSEESRSAQEEAEEARSSVDQLINDLRVKVDDAEKKSGEARLSAEKLVKNLQGKVDDAQISADQLLKELQRKVDESQLSGEKKVEALRVSAEKNVEESRIAVELLVKELEKKADTSRTSLEHQLEGDVLFRSIQVDGNLGFVLWLSGAHDHAAQYVERGLARIETLQKMTDQRDKAQALAPTYRADAAYYRAESFAKNKRIHDAAKALTHLQSLLAAVASGDTSDNIIDAAVFVSSRLGARCDPDSCARCATLYATHRTKLESYLTGAVPDRAGQLLESYATFFANHARSSG